MNSLNVDILVEHQFSDDGLSCRCGKTYYTFPFPDRMTVREHATHQAMQLAIFGEHHKREWDD